MSNVDPQPRTVIYREVQQTAGAITVRTTTPPPLDLCTMSESQRHINESQFTFWNTFECAYSQKNETTTFGQN